MDDKRDKLKAAALAILGRVGSRDVHVSCPASWDAGEGLFQIEVEPWQDEDGDESIDVTVSRQEWTEVLLNEAFGRFSHYTMYVEGMIAGYRAGVVPGDHTVPMVSHGGTSWPQAGTVKTECGSTAWTSSTRRSRDTKAGPCMNGAQPLRSDWNLAG